MAEASHPRTIVVGVDSSEESANALAWARRVAGADDSIIAVRAWEIPVMVTAKAPGAVYPYDFEELARGALAETVDATGDPRIGTVLAPGRPGRVIIDEAASADLIVVGHRGESRIALMLGSTANYVLHHAPCPVVVVRGDGPFDTRHITVGVDAHDLDRDGAGENASVRALRWAYGLPGVERIRVLHGWYVPPMAVDVIATPAFDFEAMDEAARAVVDRVIDVAGPPPHDVELVRVTARDAGGRSLIEESKDADLVVIGSRGRGGFAKLLLGSTSNEVASHAHSPVAVIR